jgi:hypothetical protein
MVVVECSELKMRQEEMSINRIEAKSKFFISWFLYFVATKLMTYKKVIASYYDLRPI